MNFFRLNPFSRILIPFILGVVLSHYIDFRIKDLAIVVSLLFALCTLLYFLCNKSESRYFRVLFGLAVSFLTLTLSVVNYQNIKNKSIDSEQLLKASNGLRSSRILEVKTAPVKGSNTYKSEVLWVAENGKRIGGIAYFKDSLSLPKEGRVIIVDESFKTFSNPTNPGQFNYANYAKSNDWFFSVFVKKWKPVEGVSSSKLNAFVGLREHLLSIVRKYLHGDEYAICAALVFGDKRSLTPEIKKAYSGAGAMHVLAVSGLHVGLVFLFLKFLLGFLDKSRKTQILKTILIIILIFSYAGLTGFSPSVTRAAVMFSLIAFGSILRRSSSIYNIIFVSAFGMLLYDPRLLFSVSFQLSYIAVIGIIYLYPRLILLWEPKSWLGYQVWSLVCLSLAAQLSTFPLAMYYFNLFPTWFLITNIVVVPGAMLELAGGFLLIIAHYLHLGEIFGWLYQNLIWGINSAVSLIELIPPGPQELGLGFVQLLIVYVLVGLFCMLIEFPKKRILWVFYLFSGLMMVSLFTERAETNTQKGLIVYDNNSLVLEAYAGNRAIVYVDTARGSLDKIYNYTLMPSFLLRHIDDYELGVVQEGNTSKIDFNIDGVLITIPINQTPDILTKALHSRSIIVLPRSMKKVNYLKWKAIGSEVNYKIWDVRLDGCFDSKHLNI